MGRVTGSAGILMIEPQEGMTARRRSDSGSWPTGVSSPGGAHRRRQRGITPTSSSAAVGENVGTGFGGREQDVVEDSSSTPS